MDATTRIAQVGLLPVIVIDDPAQAEPLAEALIAGGLPVAEVTFRTPAAAEAIKRMSCFPELLVGAGTVRSRLQVEQAVEAGAQFAVTPGISVPVITACQDVGLPIYPGTSSASDVHAATELGLTVLKFFPAEASGGVAAVKALSAPFSDVSFVPTGGISADNLADYAALPSVCAVGGSWMVAPKLLAAGEWDQVRELCASAKALVDRSRG